MTQTSANESNTFNFGLSKWVRAFLVLKMMFLVVAMISGYLEWDLLQKIVDGSLPEGTDLQALASANDTRQMVVGIVQIILSIVLIVLILCWIYRANANARRLGAVNMVFTPGWAVGWHFIPIANLWKPYQAMSEIWRASRNPSIWTSEKASPLVAWWWAFWIFSNILSRLAWRLSLKADDPSALVLSTGVTIISDFADLFPSVLLFLIVGHVFRMQNKTAQSSLPVL